jgi:hypothetical protein
MQMTYSPAIELVKRGVVLKPEAVSLSTSAAVSTSAVLYCSTLGSTKVDNAPKDFLTTFDNCPILISLVAKGFSWA